MGISETDGEEFITDNLQNSSIVRVPVLVQLLFMSQEQFGYCPYLRLADLERFLKGYAYPGALCKNGWQVERREDGSVIADLRCPLVESRQANLRCQVIFPQPNGLNTENIIFPREKNIKGVPFRSRNFPSS